MQPGGLLQTRLQRPPHGSGVSVNAGNLMDQMAMRQQGQRGMRPNQTGFMDMMAPGQMQRDGSEFFQEAAANLMMTDPDLAEDIKGRARALDMQSKQMAKLMQIGAAMGEDVSSLGPIAEQLKAQRDKIFKELIGRANVPTSASKPGKPQMRKPTM